MKIMPKLGMITNPSKEIVSEINKAKKLGFDFEIAIEPPRATPEYVTKKKSNILHAIKQFPSSPLIHTAYWCGLGDSYKEIRKAWIKEMESQIILASALKAMLFNVHFDATGMLYDEEYRKTISANYIKSLKELVSFGKEHRIKVMFENTPYPYSNFKNYSCVVDRVPGLGAHLDLGHIFVTDGMKGFHRFFSHFNKRIEHIHIHDNYGLADDHLALGKGRIDFKIVLRELKKIGYSKTITFEIHDGDLMESVRTFRRLWS